jgi:hypothetical protein
MAENTVHGVQPSSPESNPDPGMRRERHGPHDDAWRKRAALARWGTLDERFWARVAKQPGDGCWLWTGRKDKDGYGRLEAFGMSHAKAHRVAWQLTRGPIPEGHVVCHACDTPACVRPDHLRTDSQRANIRESIAKGRHGSLRQAGKKRGPYRKQAA